MSRLEKKNQLSANITFFFLVRRLHNVAERSYRNSTEKWQKVGEDGAKEFTQKRFPDE